MADREKGGMPRRRGLAKQRNEREDKAAGRSALLISFSDRTWLWLFVIGDLAGLGIAGAFPGWHWLAFIVNGVSTSATACFCYAGLRRAQPNLRLIWGIFLVAMILLAITNAYQFSAMFSAEPHFQYYSTPPKGGLGAFSTLTALSSARTVLLLFLFSQIEDNDNSSYFRRIDIAQCIMVVGLTMLVFQPSLVGGHENSILQTRWLRSIAVQLTFFFGVINWLGRPPGEARQLVGAINLYFLVKFLANFATVLHRGDPGNLLVTSYALADVTFVIAALHARRHPQVEGAGRSVLGEAIRFLNPAFFAITAQCLALMVGQTDPLLGGGLGILSVLLYVLRSARWQSDFRRLQAEIAEAALVRTNFLLDISHEIRLPLTSITLNASRLNRETRLSGDQAALTRTIHKGAELVVSTLNDILDISRLESGQLRIPLQPFDAIPVIDETADLLEPQARHRNVTIEWQQASLPLLQGNAERFRQVLINIISNAIRHAPEDSKIVIAVEEGRWDSRASARIIVTDFGEGIPPDQQALLFRRFSQLGQHAAGSSGLGLAISNALVNLMEGKIAFESKPGQTSFWVELQSASQNSLRTF
jgi:signal transduction histidine kinase